MAAPASILVLVQGLATAMSEATQEQIDAVWPYASAIIGDDVDPALTDYLRSLACAHALERTARANLGGLGGDAVGSLASVTTKSLSESYAAPGSAASPTALSLDLSLTTWGTMLATILSSRSAVCAPLAL